MFKRLFLAVLLIACGASASVVGAWHRSFDIFGMILNDTLIFMADGTGWSFPGSVHKAPNFIYSVENQNIEKTFSTEHQYSGEDVLVLKNGDVMNRVGEGDGIIGVWELDFTNGLSMLWEFKADGTKTETFEFLGLPQGLPNESKYTYDDGVVTIIAQSIFPFSLSNDGNILTLGENDYDRIVCDCDFDTDESNWTIITLPTETEYGLATAPCTKDGCEKTDYRILPKIDGTSIKNVKQSGSQPLFKANIVSDKMEIMLDASAGSATRISFVVFDMTGNVVASANGRTWDLRNRAGRFVANGTYLVIVEAIDRNGRISTYSAKLGVRR